MTPAEAVLLITLLIDVGLIYAVFRCPQCNASLVRAYGWRRLHHCPKCGTELVS